MNEPRVSVVIPVLDDATALRNLLARLGPFGAGMEIVVADGGSRDDSPRIAAAAACRVVRNGARGRGFQLHEGIAAASSPWIWMLHADTLPSAAAIGHVLALGGGLPGWGRFDVTFAAGPALELVARTMNLRSRLTGICTGDQGIFVHRTLLERIGGMPRQSLMEDIELCRRLKRVAPPDCRPELIAASPRRWQHHGAVRTVLSMWWFRWRYWRGADPERLATEYYRR